MVLSYSICDYIAIMVTRYEIATVSGSITRQELSGKIYSRGKVECYTIVMRLSPSAVYSYNAIQINIILPTRL